MIVKIDGSQYHVQFRHTNLSEESVGKLSLREKVTTPDNGSTECKILQKLDSSDTLGFVSIGYAVCHPKDNFCKEIGRQVALKKALEDGTFSKEDRTVFWNEYRNWGTKRF